jgi:hypothetical protein
MNIFWYIHTHYLCKFLTRMFAILYSYSDCWFRSSMSSCFHMHKVKECHITHENKLNIGPLYYQKFVTYYRDPEKASKISNQ